MPTEKTLRHQVTAEPVNSMQRVGATDVTGGFDYMQPRESDYAHQWRGMKRNMRHDERLDRASAQRLLDNARKLPGGKERDIAELEAEFRERFGDEQQQAPSRPGRFRDE